MYVILPERVSDVQLVKTFSTLHAGYKGRFFLHPYHENGCGYCEVLHYLGSGAIYNDIYPSPQIPEYDLGNQGRTRSAIKNSSPISMVSAISAQ